MENVIENYNSFKEAKRKREILSLNFEETG
jgi:hypothetical protein